MKKGFTLAEVLGVILVTAAIVALIIPVVDMQIKKGKQEAYDSAINSIKSSLDLYMKDYKLNNNEVMTITLYQLKQSGLVDINVKNPITNENFPNDMLITIKNEDGILKYDINDEGNNKNDYEQIPKIVLNSKTLEYVELGDTFTTDATDVTATYNNNQIDVNIESNVNTEVVGSYTVTYTANYSGIQNKIIKTVVVRDTKGPIVELETLYISLSDAKTHDYKSDILATDLSGIKSIEVETNFGALTGKYSVKYIVTDNYDNVTIKHRTVITS